MLSPALRKFALYYQPHLALFITDCICAVVVSAVALALPLLARHITSVLLAAPGPDTVRHIVETGAIMLGLLAVMIGCGAFVDYRGHMMGTYIESAMRAELFDHYQRLSFRFYDDHRTGQLMSRLTHDLFAITELAHHGPEEAIIALLKFAGAFVILLTLNVPMTLLLFLFLPVMAAYALVFNRRMNAALLRSRERTADVHAQVEDTLAGIRVVKSFANEPVERAKFAAANARFVQSRAEGYGSETWFDAGMVTFTHVMTIVTIVVGGIAIAQGALGLADLVTYLMFLAILIDPVNKFTNLVRLYQEGITGYTRFLEMMAVPPEPEDAPGAVELSAVRGAVTFRDVAFRYREAHEDVLSGVSLDIRPGEYVALVGSSGVGKSTLCALLPRFYEVSEGAILIDGHDIRSVTLRSLRQNIGVVQQEVYLFAGTVAENIRYGCPGASDDEVIAAARQANAHDFIMRLPQGYDTGIGQRGVKLSGGQKQRLSIARVFLKDPPIILFDEATSALDNESERAVQESMERLAHRHTLIVIAHRLSTIRNAGRILVLTDEGIAEQGTHEALLARGGAYAQLYHVHAGV